MGTVIRYNYIHDIHGIGEGGCRGIYLDLPGSNATIFGNIVGASISASSSTAGGTIV